jgi:hypothetical protein
LYYKRKKQDIYAARQNEDKNTHYDYGKVHVDYSSGLIGENENIKDSR